jgi:TrmH family RNA methyltransferase
VEGVRLVEEALQAGWQAQLVLYTPEVGERGMQAVEAFRQGGVPTELVAEHVFRLASDTQTPQGILAVVSIRTLPLPRRLTFVLIADGLRDPGNLGSMLRTAAAAGVEAVLLPGETVDPFSPKVLRAGMGAHFRLPLLEQTWEQAEAFVKAHALMIYLAAVGQGQGYTDANLRRPLALVVGGEAAGATTQAGRLAHAHLHIPMPGGSESLNAASAAAILLFEVVRQRSSV